MRKRISIVISVIALLSLFAGSAEASKPSEVGGPGCVGALNMLNDATMATIPMVRNNPDGDWLAGNGNAGMFHAVDVSTCP